MMKCYRQGDILMVKVNAPNVENLIKSSSPVIVGYGEATGHKHEIIGEAYFHTVDAVDPMQFAIEGISEQPIYIEVITDAELVHPEHDTVVLPPGWYESIRQREYSPEEIRYVAD